MSTPPRASMSAYCFNGSIVLVIAQHLIEPGRKTNAKDNPEKKSTFGIPEVLSPCFYFL